jgi:hypothetical protein
MIWRTNYRRNFSVRFIVNDVDEAVRAVNRVGELSRRRCRQTFEQRFSAGRMAEEYWQCTRNCLPECSHRRQRSHHALHSLGRRL